MLEHFFNPQTGEYLGSFLAKIDPLESRIQGTTVYLTHPLRATFDELPSHIDGFVRCYWEYCWQYYEDHRGQTAYKTETAIGEVVTEIGAIPEGYTLLIPIGNQEWDSDNQIWKDKIIPYETKKVLKHKEIEDLKKAKELAGVPYIFPGGIPGTIQTRDNDDFRNINATATNGLIKKGTNAKLPFRDQENRNYELTPEEGIALGEAVAAYIGAIAVASWAHKDALTEENIDTYDITTGWPE